jgi:protein O-GlcNAc transferase
MRSVEPSRSGEAKPAPSVDERAFRAALARQVKDDLPGAIAAYRSYLADFPRDARAWTNLAIALKRMGDIQGAVDSCRKALEIDPDKADAWNNLGICLMALGRPEEAARSYRRALAIEPRFGECLSNLGLALASEGDEAAAVEAFRSALDAKPNHTEALVQVIYHSLQICAWSRLDGYIARLREVIRRDAGEVNPFVLLSICPDPREQLLAARQFSRRVEESVVHLPRPKTASSTDGSGRLRIGYLSGDLHTHATAHLMAEVFEKHDRKQFEIFAYSYGPDDESAMRRRLEQAFEHFVEVRDMGDAEAAAKIASDGIDILLDLKGYTQGARPGIVALRPARCQIAYLGYPGSMGAAFIDYGIVDRYLVTSGLERHYSEKLLFLPGCYQPNDSTRAIAAAEDRRLDHGLPEHGIVFCCFNQPYKITPEMFHLWLELLRQVDGSVLWLLAFNPTAITNLRIAAQAAGIHPGRLVTAEKRPISAHLARLRHADLFLDTYPCNAHTTASDALWAAGVPVITRSGETFASRVAGSLLTALDLADLVALDAAGYFRRALELARDSRRLLTIRNRLASARKDAVLFSGRVVAAELEALFRDVASDRSGGP